MKKSLMILFCLLICLMSASGVFAKGYNKDTHKAQKKLSALGYAPGPADGVMGHKTRKAVKKFQKSRGLKVTGVLDTNTLHRLLNLTSKPAVRPAGKSNTPDKHKLQKQASKPNVQKKHGNQRPAADQQVPKNDAYQKKHAPMTQP